MKKLVTGITAIAAVAGLTSAFAFAPSKAFNNSVYATPNGTGYLYSNTPPPGLTCSITGPACTLSTTATAAYFNQHFASNFPPESQTSGAPKVTYFDAGKIYH